MTKHKYLSPKILAPDYAGKKLWPVAGLYYTRLSTE